MTGSRQLLLFLIVTSISCEERRTPQFEAFRDSLSQWKDLKKENGNSYVYSTTFGSWAGFGSTTELKIEDGNVVARKYEAFRINETNGVREITDTYAETKADLGSHEDGADLLTIDDLYHSCGKEYLRVDEANNELYFEARPDGLMTLCGFVPKGCADDCFDGVRISSFEWIQ